MSKPWQYTYEEERIDEQKRQAIKNNLTMIGLAGAIFAMAMVVLMAGCACAKEVIRQPNIDGYSVNQWCNAIYMAEGGEKSRHPYGIMASYKSTTPRQACINTVLHKWSNYKKSGLKTPFIDYLASKYAPINAKNDPTGLNRNWVKNVNYYLKKGA